MWYQVENWCSHFRNPCSVVPVFRGYSWHVLCGSHFGLIQWLLPTCLSGISLFNTQEHGRELKAGRAMQLSWCIFAHKLTYKVQQLLAWICFISFHNTIEYPFLFIDTPPHTHTHTYLHCTKSDPSPQNTHTHTHTQCPRMCQWSPFTIENSCGYTAPDMPEWREMTSR